VSHTPNTVDDRLLARPRDRPGRTSIGVAILAVYVMLFFAGGADVIAVACDVGSREQVEKVANAAIQKFGRIDTWVNDAGAAIYGRLDEVTEADNRRLFDTNFWGVVNGSLVALPHLRRQGGALINVGSEVSEAVVPLLGMYSASKHAVKGFTDGLRIEIETLDKAPVSITLIQPTAVDTPFDLDFGFGRHTLTVRTEGPNRVRVLKLSSRNGGLLLYQAPDEDGSFRVDRLGDGTYDLQAFGEYDRILAQQTIELRSNQEVTIGRSAPPNR